MAIKYETELPLVSFAIVVKNGGAKLERCLRSIKSQMYPRLEIVVVDNGSSDDSVRIAQAYGARVYSQKGSLGMARNVSVVESKGDIVAIMDADIVLPHALWLASAARKFYADKVSTVWPLNKLPPSASPITKCYHEFSMLTLLRRFRLHKSYLGGSNSLFRRKYIIEIGGFQNNLHWTSDYDLARRLSLAGFRTIPIMDPLIHDYTRSPREFIRKESLSAGELVGSDFSIVGLTITDLLLEHLAFGPRLMIDNIFKQKKLFWIFYPLILQLRLLVFGLALLRRGYSSM
jgi:glycosyltransferase involved in cell wall biosynthesis